MGNIKYPNGSILVGIPYIPCSAPAEQGKPEKAEKAEEAKKPKKAKK